MLFVVKWSFGNPYCRVPLLHSSNDSWPHMKVQNIHIFFLRERERYIYFFSYFPLKKTKIMEKKNKKKQRRYHQLFDWSSRTNHHHSLTCTHCVTVKLNHRHVIQSNETTPPPTMSPYLIYNCCLYSIWLFCFPFFFRKLIFFSFQMSLQIPWLVTYIWHWAPPRRQSSSVHLSNLP